MNDIHRYDKGQVPWDGQPNPFKHGSQWEGAFCDLIDAFDTNFFHICFFSSFNYVQVNWLTSRIYKCK